MENGGEKFRAIEEDVLTGLDLTDEFKNLEKNFPTIRSEKRELEDYNEIGSGLQPYYIKADA